MILAGSINSPLSNPDITIAGYERQENPLTGHVTWTAQNN